MHGSIEQRLLIDAVSRIEIDPGVLAGCSGPALPAGETHLRLRAETMVALGQSMGAQYVNMVGAIEPRIGALAAASRLFRRRSCSRHHAPGEVVVE